MERTYDINEVAMMTGFTTRTLRNYLTQGLLKGRKEDGVWQFTAEDLESFFAEPYVKAGLRTKRSSAVFDFLADCRKKEKSTCVILDRPASRKEGDEISAFFCAEMSHAKDVVFHYGWDNGNCRVILSGAEDQVEKIMKAFYDHE